MGGQGGIDVSCGILSFALHDEFKLSTFCSRAVRHNEYAQR